MQRNRPYTESEHLILQQAAAILNVAVCDLSVGQHSSQLASHLVTSDRSHDQPVGLDPLCVAAALDDAEQASSLEVTETATRPIPQWMDYGGPSALNESQLQSTPSGDQPDWNFTPVGSGLIPLQSGYSELSESSKARSQYTPSSSQLTSDTVTTELVPSPFLETDYSAVNEHQPSSSVITFQPDSYTDSTLTDTTALPIVFSEEAIFNEFYFAQTPIKPPMTDAELISICVESNQDAMDVLSQPTPSIAPPGNPTVPPVLGGSNPGFSAGSQCETGIQFSVENLASADNLTYNVPQCLNNSALAFPLSNSLSWESQAPPALSPGPLRQSWIPQPQVDDIAAQSPNLELFVNRSSCSDSLRTYDFWEKPLPWMSNEIAAHDLLTSQTRHFIDEPQLVLRGPSPNAALAMASDTTHSQRGKSPSEEPNTEQKELRLPESSSSTLIAKPAVNEIVFSTDLGAIRSTDGQKPRVRQAFRDHKKRKETGETRRTGACVRCHMLRVRASDPSFSYLQRHFG